MYPAESSRTRAHGRRQPMCLMKDFSILSSVSVLAIVYSFPLWLTFVDPRPPGHLLLLIASHTAVPRCTLTDSVTLTHATRMLLCFRVVCGDTTKGHCVRLR